MDLVERQRCEAGVWGNYGGWDDYQCKRYAVTTRHLTRERTLAVCRQHAKQRRIDFHEYRARAND